MAAPKYDPDTFCKMTTEMVMYFEKYGIYQPYNVKGNTLTWYSYFGDEGYFKITRNFKTGRETRKHLRFKKCPKYLVDAEGWKLYNHFCG